MKTEISPNVIEAYEVDGYVERELSEREIVKMCDLHGADFEDKELQGVSSLYEMLWFLGY